MKRTVILHGSLKNLYDKQVVVDANTAAEVVKALCVLAGRAFYPKPGQPRVEVKIVGYDTEAALFRPLTNDVTEIHIVPAFTGSGGFWSSVTKIAIGAVLVVAALYTGGWSLAAMPWYGSLMMSMGTSLVLGGLLEMVSPAPKVDLNGLQGGYDPEASKYLGSNQNTVKIGTRIPLLYGEHLHYGHYISFNVDAKQVAV